MFYAFEYFIYLNKHVNTNFYIHNITEDYLNEFKQNVLDRYNFDESLLDNIIIIDSIRDIYGLNSIITKALFLDVRSYKNLNLFLKMDCVVYANDDSIIPESKVKKITRFGWYSYQNYDNKEKLKFYFDIFKTISDVKTDTAFVSAPRQEACIIEELDIKETKVIFKPLTHGVKNLFESFDTLYYYHSSLDKNNRFIVEALYYNKEVKVTYTGAPKDSVWHRFHDIKLNGVNSYRLDDTDLVIKEMIK